MIPENADHPTQEITFESLHPPQPPAPAFTPRELWCFTAGYALGSVFITFVALLACRS